MAKNLKTGDKIAHQNIDSEDGFAKTGVTEEIIDEGDQLIVNGSWHDENRNVAFDDREIVKMAPFSDASPAILKPRHLKALIRKREVRAAFIFSILSGVFLLVLSLILKIEVIFLAGVASILIGTGLLVFNNLFSSQKT